MLRLRQLVLVLYIGFIGYVSLIPSLSMPTIGSWDKLNHGLAYGLMTLLSAWSIRSPRWFFSLLPIWVFYGGGIELLQSMVGRSSSWLDALANLVGVFAGVLIAKWVVCSHQLHRHFALANYA